jgi:hypothetical protein
MLRLGSVGQIILDALAWASFPGRLEAVTRLVDAFLDREGHSIGIEDRLGEQDNPGLAHRR